jgi:hypothetical protein
MFPPSFTSSNGLISILVGAWSPSPNYVDSVFDLVANDLVTFLPPTKNGPTHVFLGFATSGGLVILAKNGLALVIINLASFIGLASLAPILVCFPSFVFLIDHVRNHFHDLEVMKMIMLLSYLILSLTTLFLFHVVRSKKKKGRLEKNLMITLTNFKLNG